MNLEERLRRSLRSEAEAIDVTAGNSGAIAAAAGRRTRRNRLAALAATVLIVGGAGAAIVTQRGGGDADMVATEQDSSSASGGETLPNTDGTEPSLPVGPVGEASPGGAAAPGDGELGLLGVNGLVQVGAGFAAWGPSNDASFWFSPDGETWSAMADPRTSDTAFLASIGTDGSSLWAIGGHGSGPASQLPWLSESSDLENWEPVQIDLGLGSAGPYASWSATLYEIAVGPAGVVASGEAFVELDTEALIADHFGGEADGRLEHELGTPAGDLSVLSIFDSASGDQVGTIDLAAAGVDPETIKTLMSSGGIRPLVLTGESGERLAVGAGWLPGPPTSIASTPAGFYGAIFDPLVGSRALWFSADGAFWEASEVAVGDSLPAIGVLGDGILVQSGDGPLLTYMLVTDGGPTETSVGPMLGDFEHFEVREAAFDTGPTPGGAYAAIIEATNGSDSEAFLVVTTDGLEWSAQRLTEVLDVGLADATAMAVTDSSVLIAISNGAADQAVVKTVPIT